jgi:regulatory protein
MAGAPPRSLKARAIFWLSQREHSRSELAAKLAQVAGAEEQAVIEPLLDELSAKGYLSEVRFAESRVRARAAKFGARRITQELVQHGVALDAASAQQLKASEFERAQTVWRKKFSRPAADLAERAKQMRFLAGRGFDAEVIRQVVNANRHNSDSA